MRPTPLSLRLSWPAIIAVGAVLWSPAAAGAGSIDVWSCAKDGAPLTMSAWARDTNQNGPRFSDTCLSAADPARAGLLGSHLGGQHIGFAFDEPAGTQITQLSWRGSVEAQPTTGVVVTEAVAEGAGVLEQWNGPFAEVTRDYTVPVGAHRLALRLRNPDPVTTDGYELRIGEARVRLEDNLPPTATNARGDLTEPGYKSGEVAITVDAQDAGVGVRRAHLEINGIRVLTKTVGADATHSCESLGAGTRAYAQAVPCATSVSPTLSMDTATLVDGTHEVEVVLEDAASNFDPVWSGRLRVDNPSNGMPTTACTDGVDNDGDGRTDHGHDAGCISTADVSETEPPVNRSLPALSGAVRVGQSVSASAATWLDGPGSGAATARRWQACRYDGAACVDVTGQTGATLAVTPALLGRRLQLVETRSTTEGATSATSAQSVAVAQADGSLPACADGLDNDGDGLVDADADHGCASREDTTEHALGAHDDLDGDGIPNDQDPDDNGDGLPDTPVPPPTPIVDQTRPSVTQPDAGGGVPAQPTNGAGASDRARVALVGTRTRTVAHGRRIATTGRLVDEHGRPITGATLTVEEQPFVPKLGAMRGAAFRPAALPRPLLTDADGRFRWTIPAGHSRIIRVGYRARTADRDFTSVSDLTLLVPAKASFAVSRRAVRNGSAVRFSGRLLGGMVPRSGVTVVLQARTSRGWVSFKTVRAAGSGRFTGSYRFRATTRRTTYRFRAQVKGDSSYPWSPSTSATRSVTVRP